MTEDGSDADEALAVSEGFAVGWRFARATAGAAPPRIAESSAAVVNVLGSSEGDAEFASEAETAAQPGSPALTGLLPAA